MMPGTDGVVLLRDIAKLQPQVGLILMSSADGRVLRTAEGIARERQLNVLGTLAKPVAQKALSALLGRLEQSTPIQKPGAEVVKITADDLKAALACGEIIIHVQPEVHIRDRRLGVVEALARWTSPVYGSIPPDSFVPLAESCGLIRELTDVTLRAGIAACAQWRRQGLDIRVAINLSPFMLEDLSLPEAIAALAAEHGLPTRNLLLEVTESGVFKDVATSLDILARLRLRGMSLALDDYGTGHSSLKQLLRIPFTDLKLDRMFLTGSDTDPERRRVVESTITLAHDLGLKVIAEGVETEEQLQLLSDLGCDYAQGWLIARAMPVDQLVDWARSYSSNSQRKD
jgi:EAL domain-containing protein (putative c-di-GMP-specific phosphodiesterase class I)